MAKKTTFRSSEDAAATIAVLDRYLPKITERAAKTVESTRSMGIPVDRFEALARVTERAVDYARDKQLVCIDAVKQAAWDESIVLDPREMAGVHSALHVALAIEAGEAQA